MKEEEKLKLVLIFHLFRCTLRLYSHSHAIRFVVVVVAVVMNLCLLLQPQQNLCMSKEYMARNLRTIQKKYEIKRNDDKWRIVGKSRFITSISWWLKLNDIIMPYYKSCIHTHTHSLTLTCGYRIGKCNTS